MSVYVSIYNSTATSRHPIPDAWKKPFRGDIAFIVGNGIALDLLNFLDPHRKNLALTWNSQKPLDWKIDTPNKPGEALLDNLPHFKNYVAQKKAERPHISDFEIFEELFSSYPSNHAVYPPLGIIEPGVQAQHFLALAYSEFHIRLKSEMYVNPRRMHEWKWLQWFCTFGHRLGIVTSFNYDLIVETVLATVELGFRRFGVWRENGVRMFKPHGSIDYELISGYTKNTGYRIQ